MTWPAALGIAALNALFTGVVTVFVAEAGTRWHRVSNFEGGRGMLVMLGFVPLGLLAGAVLGLIAARTGHTSGASGFLKQLGCAALASGGLLLLATALARLTAPGASTRPPPK